VIDINHRMKTYLSQFSPKVAQTKNLP